MAKRKQRKFDLREDGSRSYRKTIRVNGGPLQARFSRVEDADRWYSEKLRERELFKNGISPEIRCVSFGEYAEEWLEKRKKSGRPSSSWKVDANRLRSHYIPKLRDTTIGSISADNWEDILIRVTDQNGFSNANFNRHRSLLHKLYNDAIKKGKVAVYNPISCIERRHEGTSSGWDYFSSPEEIRNYLDAAVQISKKLSSKAHFYLFALIALNTGVRVSEALDLRNSDFLIPQRRLHIATIYDTAEKTSIDRTKSKKARWVGLNDRLLAEYAKHLEQTKFKGPNDLIISNPNGGHISRHSIYTTHKQVCQMAEVKSLRVHDLRHTFASHWVMNGGSLEDLKEVLGHSNINVTQKYAHLSPDHLALKANTVCF